MVLIERVTKVTYLLDTMVVLVPLQERPTLFLRLEFSEFGLGVEGHDLVDYFWVLVDTLKPRRYYCIHTPPLAASL